MRLWRLVTLRIAVGTLMTVPLPMPCGVHYIPPLCSPGGALVSDPAGKAELLSTWFDSKQSRDIVGLPQTCHPRPAFCGIAGLLDIVCAGQLELDRGGELALVQIDFSVAFDRVNHGGLVFKAGVGDLILNVFQNFLSSRTQRVKVDGVFSSSIDVVSGVPQGSVLGPLLFLLYIADLPRLLQNELVGYADNSTLLCRIPHPRDRSSVAASLNDDLAVISDWCSRCGMLVNPSKTREMPISRFRTVEPLFPDLLIDGSLVEMVSELKILGVILDSKLSFEKQVRAIAATASMRVGILRKTMSVFRDVTVIAKCFWAFILPVLEYCSPVWMSAATSHLSLLDRVVSQVDRLSGGSVSCDLGTGAKWHLWVFSSRLTVWLITLCVVFFQRSMCWGDQPVEPWLLILDLSRCLGLELCSFRAILFCLVFDCRMGCMSLTLLVKVWVLLKLQSIAFFYKVDCPLFLPFLHLFLFHFSFSRDLR